MKPDLIREAWRLYDTLDAARMAEARHQSRQQLQSAARLLKLARLCKRAYLRFERRCTPQRVFGHAD